MFLKSSSKPGRVGALEAVMSAAANMANQSKWVFASSFESETAGSSSSFGYVSTRWIAGDHPGVDNEGGADDGAGRCFRE
jgi:hypothetical protein